MGTLKGPSSAALGNERERFDAFVFKKERKKERKKDEGTFFAAGNCSRCAARREREKSEKKTFEGKLETMGTMTDPDTALAAIKAAGDDFQSLYEAIKKADFLDKTPGDYRQQLRAAKTKLKKIHLEAKKKAEEDAKKGIVQKNYDVSKYWPQLKDTWEGLRWRLKAMPGGATKKPDAFYELYGFFKQATEGDNTEEQPVWAETGGLDFEGRSRWEANKTKGISSEVAKKKFVAIYFEM